MEHNQMSIPFISSLSHDGRARLRLDDPGTSVPATVGLAANEGVLGLLYHDANACSKLDIPSIRRTAGPSVLHSVGIAMLRRERFARLLGEFCSANIRVLLLKGIALSEFTYRTCGVRPMSDIDFLVPISDAQASVDVLRNAGLSPSTENSLEDQSTYEHHMGWFEGSGDSQLDTELHWHIVPPRSRFTIDVSELWRNAVEREFHCHPVWTLSPEHTLLHLCIHWHSNGYRPRLRDMFDLFAVSSCSGELDWERVAQEAREWNAEAVVYMALSEMMRYFRGDDDLARNVAGLRPRRLVQKHIALPIANRRMTLERVAWERFINGSPSYKTAARSNDVENLVLAVSGRQTRDLCSWFLPSKQRVADSCGCERSQISAKHYACYYYDCLRRGVTGIAGLCRPIGR